MNASKRRCAIAGVMLAALLLPLLGGCASPAFTAGVKVYAPDVADELKDYAANDPAIDVDTRASIVAAADALLEAVNAKIVFLAPVEAAWKPARDFYTPLVSADADLDEDEKNLRAKNVAKMDRLIADEGASLFDLLGAGGSP